MSGKAKSFVMLRGVVVMALVATGLLIAPAAASAAPKCDGHTATIVGTNGDDRILGTGKTDVIAAKGGEDFIRSLNGDDLVCAGDGEDTVKSGSGGDFIDAGAQGAEINAGEGDDEVVGQFDSTVDPPQSAFLGDGADQMFADVDLGLDVSGEDGDDYILLNVIESARIFAGTGDDVAYVLPTGPQSFGAVVGQTGDDELGTAGALIGGDGVDLLLGFGFDLLEGGSGDDEIIAGGGDDEITGDDGDDFIDTGASGPDGDETEAGSGDDEIVGGGFVQAGSGDDRFQADSDGGQPSSVFGGSGADEFFGGDDFGEYLEGGDGGDLLIGNGGPDLLDGVDGADRLFAGTGDDLLFGGPSDDVLFGDDGDDLCDGETGEDGYGPFDSCETDFNIP
jgi:Ca2+-binding RTX toxin-like protein